MIETRFKDTEVGRIPMDWDTKKIRSIAEVHGRIGFRGYTVNDLVQKGRGALVIGGKHISNNYLDLRDPDYISWAKYYESPEIMVREGDLVIAQRGTLGRVAHINMNIGPATINPSLVLLNHIKCNSVFLHLMLSSGECTNRILSMSSQTSIPMISQLQIENFPIVFPPINEQSRIASALNSINNLISSLGKLIEKKRAIKQGAMQQLLTSKKRLKGFSEPWVKKELGEILQYEQPTKYLVSSTDYSDNGVPVLTAGKTFILGYTNESKGIYNNLPVIIFDDFVTESKYVDFPFKAKSSAMKMLTLRNDKNNLRFVFEIMQMIDFPMTDHKRWWIGEYCHVVVKIPSFDEQNAIASVLSSMDEEISALEAKREKYIAIKQGMMQQLLTGKIRLID